MLAPARLRLLVATVLFWSMAAQGCSGSLELGDDDDVSDDDVSDDDMGDDDDDDADDDAADDDTGDDDACADVQTLFDFDGDEQGFGHAATDAGFADPWEFGTPMGGGCATGNSCWGTRLTDEYGDCEAGELVSPAIDLSACAGAPEAVQLRFQHIYQLEDEYGGTWYDGGLVQLSADGGASWHDVSPDAAYQGVIEGNYSECPGSAEIDGHMAWSGSIPGNGWSEVTVVVEETDKTADFRVRFLFGSDRSATDRGWYVDDVAVVVQ